MPQNQPNITNEPCLAYHKYQIVLFDNHDVEEIGRQRNGGESGIGTANSGARHSTLSAVFVSASNVHTFVSIVHCVNAFLEEEACHSGGAFPIYLQQYCTYF